MDFIVIGLPQIPHPNQRCGQRITVDGNKLAYYYNI